MKTRYTSKQLEADVKELNAKLEDRQNPFRFVVGGRYGYTAIDLATPEQITRHCCERMLAGGTPRECLAACYKYIATA
jgi:hypothetical protein